MKGKKIIIGGTIVTIVLGVIGFVGVSHLLRSITPYEEVMEKARANPDVVSVTGTPVEGSRWVFGSGGGGSNSANVDVSWSISGPDGDGSVYVVASGSEGNWNYESVVFEFDDGAEVDLLE